MSIRRARLEDKEQMLEISKDVWEGTDYIPMVVDQWLSDEKGEFTVLEVDGKVRAYAKFTYITDEDVWLEGIRVDRNHRKLGYANIITQYYIEKAIQLKAKTLKFSTYYENYGSIKSGEKHGFIRECGFTHMTLVNPEMFTDVKETAINCNEPEIAWEIIKSSNEYQLSNGYLAESWKFYKLSKEKIKEHSNENRIIISPDKKALLIYKVQQNNLPNINFYCGEKESLKTCLNSFHKLKPAGDDELEVMTYPTPLNEVLEQSGYKLWEESISPNVYMFNYPLTK
ncbi:GNAT family N-acetyltransferase [Alkalicella caledoniensis]|uniref:GNAT family N-acetyltransferase n=1 Tax=Alkalicella caledoniensis TaxID=2731377 RepID=A0A7G9W516_ALKCA|nr:GNAT family N-acetyltransferase [Alkalicella caledoniensis]QNO13778.1 GNAT family N-acetyltransferase [Alkalicella caledoniensis]